MKHLWILLLGILGLAACNPDKKRVVVPEEVRFQTSESSELFFKNMRQNYYDKIDDPNTKLEQYRIEKRPEVAETPYLYLCIVNNWRFDEAYILVEPNPFLSGKDDILVHWQDTTAQTSGTYQFSFGNKNQHYQFASQLYNSIVANHQLQVQHGEKALPLMATPDEREAFRITMMDYYRLVGVF